MFHLVEISSVPESANSSVIDANGQLGDKDGISNIHNANARISDRTAKKPDEIVIDAIDFLKANVGNAHVGDLEKRCGDCGLSIEAVKEAIETLERKGRIFENPKYYWNLI